MENDTPKPLEVRVERRLILKHYDLRDLFKNVNDLFAAVRISDSLRRKVIHLNTDGDELCCFEEAFGAYLEDGQLIFCDDNAEPEIGH